MRGGIALWLACSACGFSVDGGAPGTAIDAPNQPPIDAPPDAPPTWAVVETIAIDSANPVAQVSAMTLEALVPYRLRASGTALVIPPHMGDADYFDFSAPKDDGCCEDIGIGVDDTSVDLDTTPDWGPYTPTHIYEIEWIGKGGPISAVFQDTLYTNNSGTLTLEILAFR